MGVDRMMTEYAFVCLCGHMYYCISMLARPTHSRVWIHAILFCNIHGFWVVMYTLSSCSQSFADFSNKHYITTLVNLQFAFLDRGFHDIQHLGQWSILSNSCYTHTRECPRTNLKHSMVLC